MDLTDLERLEAPDRSFAGHRDILTRSLARYHFIARHLDGAILEVGCGRGYGMEIMASRGTRIGVDLSREFLREARDRISAGSFVQASGDALPFANSSFDCIIALEVIEHIQDDLAVLAELKRLARANACIAISTPNRLVVSGHVERPLNPFHFREYTAREFHALLREFFSSVAVYGQSERSGHTSLVSRLIDRVPVRWKYLAPASIQARLSVALRPPLRLEECRFQTENLDQAHTFVALCRP